MTDLLISFESKLTNNSNGENVPELEIVNFDLVLFNLVNLWSVEGGDIHGHLDENILISQEESFLIKIV